MKMLSVCALFLSFQALACPDLSGTYALCRAQNGIMKNLKDVVMTQNLDNSYPTFTLQSTEVATGKASTQIMKADGVSVSKTDRHGVMETTRTYCDGNALIQEIIYSQTGVVLGTGQRVMIKDGAILTTTILGNLGTEVLRDQLICE